MAAMKRLYLLLTLAVALAAPCLRAQTPPPAATPTDPRALLQQALAVNGIEAPGLVPWHMKATFQFINLSHKPTDTYTLDEIWAGPQRWKTVWIGPGFEQTTIVNEKGRYQTNDQKELPELLGMTQHAIVNPLSSLVTIPEGYTLTLKAQQVGPLDLRCVLISPPNADYESPHTALGLSYCFQSNQPILRIFELEHGHLFSGNVMGHFQNRSVAMNLMGTSPDHQHVAATVDKLEAAANLSDADFLPPVGAVNLDAFSNLTTDVVPGKLVSWTDAKPPILAEFSGRHGIVRLGIVIGTDGHVRNVIILKDPTGGKYGYYAKIAAQQWVYTPYTRNGVPIEAHIIFDWEF